MWIKCVSVSGTWPLESDCAFRIQRLSEHVYCGLSIIWPGTGHYKCESFKCFTIHSLKMLANLIGRSIICCRYREHSTTMHALNSARFTPRTGWRLEGLLRTQWGHDAMAPCDGNLLVLTIAASNSVNNFIRSAYSLITWYAFMICDHRVHPHLHCVRIWTSAWIV